MGWYILIIIGAIVLAVIFLTINDKIEQKKLHLCLLKSNRSILKKSNFV